MRTIKQLLLGIIVLAGFASQAAAQTTEPPMFFFSVNIAGQAREQSFTESSTFAIYNESGAAATTHVIGGGPLFDISAGARVWRDVGVAIGYTAAHARYIHAHPEWHFAGGRSGRWLEEALEAEADAAGALIADTFRSGWPG